MEYFLDSGNNLNMLKIQKFEDSEILKQNISERSVFSFYISIFKLHCLTLDLPCTAKLGTIFFRFVSAFKLISLSDLLGFKYAYFCEQN